MITYNLNNYIQERSGLKTIVAFYKNINELKEKRLKADYDGILNCINLKEKEKNVMECSLTQIHQISLNIASNIENIVRIKTEIDYFIIKLQSVELLYTYYKAEEIEYKLNKYLNYLKELESTEKYLNIKEAPKY
ncbi:hypothetical protein M0P65_05415 [Candidatus Gracilibacteria bacterium]|nr:hypothetical protein [Candidatus Gracilibacteria bacterium]